MAEAREHPALALVPWLALGAADVYLAYSYTAPPSTTRTLAELALVLVLGLVVRFGLPSFPGTATALPPLIPLFSLAATQTPRSLGAIPYLVGLLGMLGVVAVPLMKRRGVPWWLSAILAVAVTVGCYAAQGPLPLTQQIVADTTWPTQEPALPPPVDAGPPVILITIDTLRADAARQMSSVQRLSARGAWWDAAISTSSWTLPALASIQTGVMPGAHGAGCLTGGHCQGVRDDVPTLAEQLAARGYTNVAIVANPWATAQNGMARGFHRYHPLGSVNPRRLLFIGNPLDTVHHQDAEVVLDLATDHLDALTERGGSFYLWVHLLDPHMPYLNAENPEYRSLTAEVVRSVGMLSAEDRQAVRDAYDHEVAVLDRRLATFLDEVEQRRLFDRAVVMLTSDHGEEFWEHGGFEHGHSHHREVVQVPLVFTAPGVAPGQRDGLPSLLDVAPTLRAITGLPADGHDLRSALPADRIVTSQGNLILWPGCSARDAGTAVLIDDCGAEDERIRRYDLVADPGERAPLPVDGTHRVQWAAEDVVAPTRAEAAPQNTEALRALGYVQ